MEKVLLPPLLLLNNEKIDILFNTPCYSYSFKKNVGKNQLLISYFFLVERGGVATFEKVIPNFL